MIHNLSINSKYNIYKPYHIWYLFDISMIICNIVLFICYFWALFLGHIGIFCDISELGIHMPERVLFRFNFAIIGSLLIFITFPINYIITFRLNNKYNIYCKLAGFCQLLSGIGVILVGACNPIESLTLHIISAILGFGGSFVTQVIYNILLFYEDKPSIKFKKIHKFRSMLSIIFFISAILFGLGKYKILPEPYEHIFEWLLWFCLLIWYSTFRIDLSNFDIVGVEINNYGYNIPITIC